MNVKAFSPGRFQMSVLNITRSFGIVGLFVAVGCASAQNATTASDPYNPNTRRTAQGNQPPEPSLIDMGFGTDEGNVGPFVTNTDKQYAQSMSVRGMMEIRLGQAALEKSGRDDVKSVAHRMITDYLGWDAGMEKAAAKLGIAMPSEMDAKDKAEVDRISALSGPEFDRAYLKEVIRLQTKALTMSHHEASNAAVSGFRHWAGIVIPNLQEQVHEAQKALDGTPTEISRK
jgi:putative membrane protein